MRGTPAWRRTGWLPELEEASWPRLEKHRVAHETALAALAEAHEPDAQAAALHDLCNVVEGAFKDLKANFGEAEAAISAAQQAVKKAVTPTTVESSPGIVDLEEDIKARQEAARRESEARIATRPKLEALMRDWAALSRVLNSVINPEGEALLEGKIMPLVLAQVAETRAELPTAVETTPAPEQETAPEPAPEEEAVPESTAVPEREAAPA